MDFCKGKISRENNLVSSFHEVCSSLHAVDGDAELRRIICIPFIDHGDIFQKIVYDTLFEFLAKSTGHFSLLENKTPPIQLKWNKKATKITNVCQHLS